MISNKEKGTLVISSSRTFHATYLRNKCGVCSFFLLFQIEIVQQGSSAGSDLFLLFGGTLCCLAWLLYGYLLNDVFVYVSGDVRIRYYNCYCCSLIRKQLHQCFQQILITVNLWGHHRSGRSTLLILHSNHLM